MKAPKFALTFPLRTQKQFFVFVYEVMVEEVRRISSDSVALFPGKEDRRGGDLVRLFSRRRK